MMRAAFAVLILALAAGILGITGLAGTWSETAEILFLALMVMFLVMLMSGQRPRRDATDWHTSTSWALDVMDREAGGRTPAASRTVDTRRVSTVREAFHQKRLAHDQRRLSMFYLEHNLFEQARDSRQLMIGHLRIACQQWRQTIGASS
jgi:uncharacterized membrane protein YtjA (UPF0391 family)